MGRKNGAQIATTVYSGFKGADFSTDPSLVARNRSPLCTNIMADAGGMPEKRVGWRVLHTITGKSIHGLFVLTLPGATHFLAHAGTELYHWTESDTAPTLLLTGLPEARSRGAALGGKLWIVTGAGFYCYDGTTAAKVTETAPYIPTVIITRSPTGGGSMYEDVNLLTPYRKDAFQTDGSTTVFQLDSDVDESGAVTVWVWGEEMTEGTDYTLNRALGTVTFTTAPAAPLSGSEDGVVVQFPHTVEGYSDMIEKCTILTLYGVGSNDRLVLSGNPDYPNRDWIGGLGDGSYFPDLGYACVGAEGSAIRGYCPVGSSLAIVKEDNGQDTTVFLRSCSTDADGEVVFPLRQAISGVGAVSPGAFATMLDDPLFLSGTGICAVTTSNLTSEKITQNRSFFLNAKLRKEPGLASAEAVVWDGMYLLSVGEGRVYVLDGRQRKTYRSETLGDYVYEGYYWENIPAACWLVLGTEEGEHLYFGTADGRICKFNSDMDTVKRFADDGEPISAVWATRYDDDGVPSRLKTLLKPGCCVTIKPYARSSGTVYFRSDRSDGTEQTVASATMDILNFGDIDFERFTFSSDESPQEIFLRTKLKNYKRLQIIVRNSEPEEGFGVYQITKHFVRGNFARR